MTKVIKIFDTTLRDGEQSPGASMNIDEKLNVAQQLAKLKVDVIEAGFPISSQGDFDAVKMISETIGNLKDAPAIAGLCRANLKDIDRAWEALQSAKKPRIHTFIATSDIHLKHKLNKTREEVLDLAVKAVAHAKQYTDDVEFSAEDASRSDFDYLCQVVEAVIKAGATTVNIPDTVGYALPDEYAKLIRTLLEKVPNSKEAVFSVHCHDDLGLGVANSLAAVHAGALQVECTINGIGERAGNSALEEVVMGLATRKDYFDATTQIDTREIYPASRLVSDVTGIAVQPNKAVVGSNAFAHEAGIHQHGVMQDRRTYEIMDATAIGLTSNKIILGKHSGRHAFEQRLEALGYTLTKEKLDKAFIRFKDLADKKKEIFDQDLESIVADEVYNIPETYRLEYMSVMTTLGGIPTAAIRVRSGEKILQEVEAGVGSVDAVYQTIDKLISVSHKLIDYSVKSVTGGTDALGEVTVKLGDDDENIFTGRGSSLDIIEASAKAYIQAVNKLVHYHSHRSGEDPGGRIHANL